MAPLAELIGNSPGIAAVREQVQRLARQVSSRRQPPILIEGETGTGKGLVARLIHTSGPRAARPFVDVNCAAIPETLIEAELFGYERGAFTDARQAKPGLFQLAHNGTIFLDEIGLLPDAVQAKLLKVIEERAVRRLGGTRGEPVDIAIASATNEDLEAAVRERRFRADLYHRLAVLRVALPALRDRGDDVLLLADHYLAAVSQDYGLPAHTFAPDARRALQRYPWPGNVRELRNVIERAALIAESPRITAAMLGLREVGPIQSAEPSPAAPPVGAGEAAPPPATPMRGAPVAPASEERTAVEEALRETDWNISRAAARLGITRNTIRYRIEKFGLRPDTAPPRPGRTRPAPDPVAAAPAGPELPPAREATAAVSVPVPTPDPVAATSLETRRVTFLRARFTARSDAEMITAGRIDETLLDKVQMFGGALEPVDGGDVVAVFGLTPAEDAPRRAASAAMAMQREVARDRTGVVSIVIHLVSIPIHRSGDAVEADEGAVREVVGSLDGLAREHARPGIFVTDAMVPFLQRRFDLDAVTPALYRLVGAERAGLGAGMGGRLATFVGRQQELQFVAARFAAVARGHGEVVGVSGAAGLGKSRLLFEFRQQVKGTSATFLEGHCVSYGGAIAYLPVLEVVRGALGITESDRPVDAEQQVRAAVDELDLPIADAGSLLMHALGLGDAEATVAAIGPEAAKSRTFEVIRGLLLGLSRRQPLVIAIEDLHWIDRTSEEFLVSLADVVAGTPVLLVTTYRPGYQPAWMGRSYATQIALQPLTPDDGAQVVRSLFGDDAVEDAVVRLILQRAEGNPFFLEELVREVREQGGRAPSETVPETVEAVLLARLDRLPFADRQLLQAAAVIGRTVPTFLLWAVSDLSEDDLRSGLRRLRGAEFLYENAVGEAAHVFAHVLTQEVAYQSLPAEERCRLHARVAEFLERLDPARRAAHLERLADHCLHGQLWAKAVNYLRQAAQRALARSAYRESAQRFEGLLEALGRLPETRQTLEQAIDVRFELRNALQPLGEFDRIARELRHAETLAIALGDAQRLGRALAFLTDYWRLMGDSDRATEAGRRALEIADAHGDVTLQVAARTWLGQLAYAAADYLHAISLFRRNVETLAGHLALERLGMPQLPAVHSRTCLAWCLAELGEFPEAISRGEEAMQLARSVNHPLSLAVAGAGLGTALVRRGAFAEAIPVLEEALDRCRAANLPLWIPRLVSALGGAYTATGRAGVAQPLLEAAVRQAQAMKLIRGQSLLVGIWSYANLLAGNCTAARDHARRALELAREHREPGYEAWILRFQAEVALRGRPMLAEEAEARFHDALARAQGLGMRPLTAHCHLGLARLYRHRARPADAEHHRIEAASLYAALDMRFWLPQCAPDQLASG
jgi:DNA-binding NtrC family response regulator/tetratricopeptide (TPR) repeat protein